jgi:hypothetical protein
VVQLDRRADDEFGQEVAHWRGEVAEPGERTHQVGRHELALTRVEALHEHLSPAVDRRLPRASLVDLQG